MADTLEFQLELKLDQANAKLDEMINQTNQKAAKGGQTAGQGFGSAFQNIVSAYLGAISFNTLISGIQGAVGAYSDLVKSNTALKNVVDSTNAANAKNTAILKDGNSTLEQRASALGYTTDQLYKTESASKAGAGATNELEQAIKKQQRALDDLNAPLQKNINSLDDQLNAIKKVTNAQVAQIRGTQYDQLQGNKDSLDIELNKLQTQKDQLILQGGFTFTLDNEIAQLQKQKALNDDKIKAIDLQTNAVERQAKTQEQVLTDQINNLRAEMTANKNKFDIDIEPAKRKLEDLKASFSGGGTTKVLNQKVVDQINKKSQEGGPEEIKYEELFKSISDKNDKKSLYNKYGGIISSGTINSAASNLIQGGLTDTKQITALIDRYINEQAQGKSAGVDAASAVLNLSDSFKTGNSMIGNQSGQAQNYKQIDATGLNEFNKQNGTDYKSLEDGVTEADKAQIRYLGTIKLTEAASKGLTNALVYNKDGTVNMTDSIKKGIVSNDIYAGETRRLSQRLGEDLAPAFYTVLAAVTPLIAQFSQWVKDNPELVRNITIGVVAFTGLFTVISSIMGIVGTASGILVSLGSAFGVAGASAGVAATAGEVLIATMGAILGPVTLVIIGIAALTAGLIWAYQNVGWFRDGVNDTFEKVKVYITTFKDHWQERIGEIIGFFATLPIKLPLYVMQAGLAIGNYLKNRDWGGMWNGFLDGFKSMWESLKNWFQDNWKSLGNGFRDFLVGMLKGIVGAVPGADNLINPLIDKIPRFAKGGYFDKPTMGIFGEAGDEAILNFNAIRFLGLNPESVAELNSGQMTDNSVSGSYNNTTHQNFGNAGGGFMPQTFFNA